MKKNKQAVFKECDRCGVMRRELYRRKNLFLCGRCTNVSGALSNTSNRKPKIKNSKVFIIDSRVLMLEAEQLKKWDLVVREYTITIPELMKIIKKNQFSLF